MATKKLKSPFEDYTISSNGVLTSMKGGKAAPVATRKDTSGHMRANISGAGAHGFKTVYLHKLVMEYFGPAKPDEASVILHKDGNKANNAKGNLKWGTKSENAQDREKHKRGDSLENLLRIDSGFKVKSWEKTPEGYLRVKGVSAKVGLLEYQDERFPSGVRREFVSIDALRQSTPSLIGKPITLEHPPNGEVNPENFRIYARGHVLNAWYDEETEEQWVDLFITDEEALNQIDTDNLRELSPGYRATMQLAAPEDEADFIQTARAHNHLALTEAGRGGPSVSIRLDSAGHVITHGDSMADKEKPDEGAEEMKAKMDAMQAKMDAMQGKIDAFEAMAKKKEDEDQKKADAEGSEEEKMDAADFVELYNERRAIETLAEAQGIQLDSKLDNGGLKRQVVESQNIELRADSKDAVDAAYDVVVSLLPKKNSAEHLAHAFRRNRTDSQEAPAPVKSASDVWKDNRDPQRRSTNK